MKETELKPCPFCGGEVELKDCTSNFYGFNGYEIKCNCGCRLKSHLCSEMVFNGNKCSTPVTERGKSKALSDLVSLWNGIADSKRIEGEWEFATNHFFNDYGDLKVYATASCSECKKAYPFNPTVASEFVERPEILSAYEDWDIDVEPIKAEVLKRAKSNKSLYPFCPNCGSKMKGGAE